MSFFHSVNVTSDILPQELEKKVRDVIIKKLAEDDNKFSSGNILTTKTLEFILRQDIHWVNEDGEKTDNIDQEKLSGLLAHNRNLKFLENTDNFGVQVVAYFLRRYQQIKQAFSCMRQEPSDGSLTTPKKSNRNNQDHVGGGEVFRAFTTAGQYVLTQDFIEKVKEIAAVQSEVDFYNLTIQGTRFLNNVEERLQLHLDAYYTGHKFKFKGEQFKDAKHHMEVYIKLMYYVQRGLITPFEKEGQKYINASWGEIGTFFVSRLSYIDTYMCWSCIGNIRHIYF